MSAGKLGTVTERSSTQGGTISYLEMSCHAQQSALAKYHARGDAPCLIGGIRSMANRAPVGLLVHADQTLAASRAVAGLRLCRLRHRHFCPQDRGLAGVQHSTRRLCTGCPGAGAPRPRRAAKGSGLIHYSDRGSQYLAIRHTERLTEAGVEPSVDSVGDSYDNALAETINGLYKTEVIRPRGRWRTLEAAEFHTLEWVDWFNLRCLLEPIGNIPPAEAEARYYVPGQKARASSGENSE